VLPPRATTTSADSRCSRRRSVGGDGGTTLFRSARSDEDGGNPANIAASEASNQTQRAIKHSDVRAAALQEEMAEQRFSVPPDPTKTAASQRHRRERSEQLDRARCASGSRMLPSPPGNQEVADAGN
jgi:hypothetical protein